MRHWILLLPLALAACATTGLGGSNLSLDTTAKGQPLAGALCTVTTNAGSWDVVTPGTVPVGSANGDLRVSCNKLGYRSSDVIYQASGASSPGFGVGLGGGSGNVGVGFGLNFPLRLATGNYPSRITVEMNPK